MSPTVAAPACTRYAPTTTSDHVGQVRHAVEQRLERGPHAGHHDLGLPQLPGLGLEPGRLKGLGAERLDHHEPVEALVDAAR